MRWFSYNRLPFCPSKDADICKRTDACPEHKNEEVNKIHSHSPFKNCFLNYNKKRAGNRLLALSLFLLFLLFGVLFRKKFADMLHDFFIRHAVAMADSKILHNRALHKRAAKGGRNFFCGFSDKLRDLRNNV